MSDGTCCRDGWRFGYGYFLGGDPRHFRPDRQCCRPQEIAEWEAACVRWDAGNETDEGASGAIMLTGETIGRACGHRFGIGTYRLPCEDEACAWKRGAT